MANKPRGLDQFSANEKLSTNDQAIYDYLDDMFREPDAAQKCDPVTRETLSTEITLNQSLSHQTAPLLKAVPQRFAEPARLHINPNIMTLQAFKERPPQSLIPSPIVVPMPANELMEPEEDIEEKVVEESVKEELANEELVEEKVITKLVVETPDIGVVPASRAQVSEPVPEKVAVVESRAVEPVVLPEKVVNPADIEVETEQVLAVHLPPMDEWQNNGRPDWAQERFECLIFNVSGLKLAVPLTTLGAIHQIDKKFNLLPGQDDWFIGILRTPTGNINVIDTALCVMPERYKPEDRENLKFVISLHGYEWGLACHDVSNSITLTPEEVRWRTERGKRPWLAGTVIEHMCSLIDTDGFHRVIERAEKR